MLDDPLSALDVHTEARVEAALRRVLDGVTALVVVHRSSTVSLADRAALLWDGTIAAVGTHSELLADERYRAVLAHEAEDLDAAADAGRGGGGVSIHMFDDEVPSLDDVDLTRTDGGHVQDAWRGVAVEDADDVTGTLAGFLRRRSRALLGSILRPHRRSLVLAGCLISIRTMCVLATPLLVSAWASTTGSRPCQEGGSGEPAHDRAGRRSPSSWSRP